jgi:hypothetical protein
LFTAVATRVETDRHWGASVVIRQTSPRGEAVTGYDVNLVFMAQKIGELRAVSDSVLAAATALECPSGDLGPGDLSAAVQELASAWRDGIEEIGTRISEMSDHVSSAMDNYEVAERSGYDAFKAGVCPTMPGTVTP